MIEEDGLFFTDHVITRCEQRGISRATVKACVLHGDKKAREDGTIVSKLIGFKVISEGKRIITVYDCSCKIKGEE